MQRTPPRNEESPVSKEDFKLSDVLLAGPSLTEYTPEQYKNLKFKADYYLLPLMWLCYGIQSADKIALALEDGHDFIDIHGERYFSSHRDMLEALMLRNRYAGDFIYRMVTTLVIFVIVGLVTSKWKNLRLYIMALATIPPFIGFLGMALIESSASTKWTKWGMLSRYLGWTLIPSNVPGCTKRTVTSSFTFICFCAGNICGSQIFKDKDTPTYMPGIIACNICLGLDFLIIVAWHMTLVLWNRHRDKAMLMDGLTEEEREMQGKINGKSDLTDFEYSHFRYTL
ncbi:uncharacterized protein EV420DRAFT_1652803 [Desarmillaria tabescens]|uniref:Uncharacterized protein n=1 Tax=Armillaria tabescens TaxID=1929756 RepID=A0AA39J5R4_ARMTA|nr:uncharacterized protein EV420DRAFT_1652803 [Desarmillaria tabescens]KAK0435945.1 hypothetical protein EV420DRAFT_1652803 [Desarmillaria tabescens]